MHGHLLDPALFADVELLLIAGDIVPLEVQRDIPASVAWLSGAFAAWLDAVPAGEVIACAGNHDFFAPSIGPGVHRRVFGARWTYLADAEMTTETGLRVYGTPWIPFLSGGWAYTAPKSHEGDFLAERFEHIPENLDILLTHSPPYGLRDVTQGGEHMGSRALLGAVQRRHPRLVVCGHVHESRGATGIGTFKQWTVVANCCMLGWDYRPNQRPPMQFLVPPRPAPVEVAAR